MTKYIVYKLDNLQISFVSDVFPLGIDNTKCGVILSDYDISKVDKLIENEEGLIEIKLKDLNEIKVKNDIEFGESLILLFLTDNRNDPNITSAQSTNIMNRFKTISDLLKFGDIKMSKYLIELEEVDSVVFTETRKNKYLELINKYLTNN